MVELGDLIYSDKMFLVMEYVVYIKYFNME